MLRVVTEVRDGRNFVKEWELVPGNFSPTQQDEYAVAHVGMDPDFPMNFQIFYVENNALHKAAINTTDRIIASAGMILFHIHSTVLMKLVSSLTCKIPLTIRRTPAQKWAGVLLKSVYQIISNIYYFSEVMKMYHSFKSEPMGDF